MTNPIAEVLAKFCASRRGNTDNASDSYLNWV